MPLATRPIFGAEPRELSLLFTLFYIASSGNEQNPGTFERNFDTRGGGQQSRFVGGSQTIALKIAAQLGGSRVVLGSPVRRIVQGASGRHGILGQGDRQGQARDRRGPAGARREDLLRAAAPVPARPADPALRAGDADQGRGRVRPPVLARRRTDRPGSRHGRTRQRHVRRLAADRYQQQRPGHRVRVRRRRQRPLLQRAVAGRPPGLGARPVREVLRRGSAAATGFFETFWSGDEWARGCPVGIPSTGALLAYGPWLRQPAGRIHWAGTETSNYWNGYMDGAVRSGERASGEVLNGL